MPPAAEVPLAGSLYHKASGFCSPNRLPLALAAALLGAAALGVVYGYIELYIPIVGYVTILLVGGFAWLIGGLCGKMFTWAHVRNTALAAASAVLVSAFGLYTAWVAFLYGAIARQHMHPLLSRLVQPSVLYRIISSLAQHSQSRWLFWLVELVVVIGYAVLVTVRATAQAPYCSTCHAWCSRTASAALATGNQARLKQAMERQDYTYLADLGPPKPDAAKFNFLQVYTCPVCKQTNTLNISQIHRVRNRRGRIVNKAHPFLRHLAITPAVAENIRQFGEFLKMPRPPVPLQPLPPVPLVEARETTAEN